MCPSQIVCQSANTDPTVPPKDRPTRHISNCDYRAPGKGRSVRRSANLGGSRGSYRLVDRDSRFYDAIIEVALDDRPG
jgi:hypothetical protein